MLKRLFSSCLSFDLYNQSKNLFGKQILAASFFKAQNAPEKSRVTEQVIEMISIMIRLTLINNTKIK